MAVEKDWKAYGDKNPLEHGGIWIREDEDCKGSFYIVSTSPTDDGSLYLYKEGYVTPTDDWIDADEVYSFADLDDNSTWEEKAMSAFEYYSVQNFGGEEALYTATYLAKRLKSEGIEV